MKDWKTYRDIADEKASFQNEDMGTTTGVYVCFAGSWIRFCAVFWDFQSTILGLVVIIVSFWGFDPSHSNVHSAIVLFIFITLYVVYDAWMISRYGATTGKRALGLMVVQPDGSPITYRHAFLRCWIKILGGMLLGLGIIMAVFDREKRALHDRICGTRVIRIRKLKKR